MDLNIIFYLNQLITLNSLQRMELLPYQYQELKPLRQKSSTEYEPDEEQIEEYARYIGVKYPEEAQLMWDLAKEGVQASLPLNWQACQTPDGELLYRNKVTKAIQQEHPMDQTFRQKVIALREAHQKYLEEEAQAAETSQLHTIPQQKSQDKSLHQDSQLDELMMPSKQFFQPSETLRQQENFLNQAMMEMNENSNSNQVTQYRQNSKFLANFSSSEQKNKTQQQFTQKTTEFKSSDPEHTRQKLRMELQHLKNQQKLAQQLLSELQRDNQRRQKKLKQKLHRKHKKITTKTN